jgi:hypothetical protein
MMTYSLNDPTPSNDEELAALRVLTRLVVESANANRAILTGDFEQVRQMVDGHDVVYGVWQDAAEVDGVGMLLIKGEQLLRHIVADAKTVSCSIVGIPCVEAAQAEALRQVAGEQDRRH